MKITKPMLLRVAPNAYKANLEEDVRVFNEWAPKFGVTTELRIQHFFAQILHESGEFKYTEELASGAAYDTGRKAKALGNTPEADGDGQKYKGRGYIQLTGRSNYLAYAKSGYCVGDLMAHPEWLCNSPGRMKSALWFWWKNGLNALADRDDIVAVTKKVNGGTNGLAQRKYYLRQCKKYIVE